MPKPRRFFAKSGRLLQATGLSAVTAVVAAAAILYPGVKSADVDLNDGGVWVTNKSMGMTARLKLSLEDPGRRRDAAGGGLRHPTACR